jgi:hypothetical protein
LRPCQLHNDNNLEGNAKSGAEKQLKKEGVWQKNKGVGPRIFHIFLRFFNFAWPLSLHVPANQSFAQIGVITKKDA